MNSNQAIIGGIWLLTLAGAFAIGSSFSGSSENSTNESKINQQTVRSDSRLQIETSAEEGQPLYGLTNKGLRIPANATPAQLSSILSQILREPNYLRRQTALANLVEQLGPENIEQVIASLGNMSWRRAGDRDAMRMLLYAWGQFDAEGALDHIKENMDNRAAYFANATVVSSWGQSDFKAAAEWAQNQEDRAARYAISTLASDLALTDPVSAAQFINSLDPSKVGRRTVGSVATEYAKTAPWEAAQWAQTLKEDSHRSQALEEVAEQWASSDPVAAAQWVAQLASEPGTNEATKEVASRLAADNPEFALGWAADLPTGNAQASAQKAAISRWTRQDAGAVADYINKLPASSNADPFIEAYSRQVARQDPENAMGAALAIDNDQVRSQTLKQIGQYWLRRDNSAANAWLQQSELSEAEQSAITKGSGGRQRLPWSGLD